MKKMMYFLITLGLLSSALLCFSGCNKTNIKAINVIGWNETTFKLGNFKVKNYLYNATSSDFDVLDEGEFLEVIKADDRFVGKVNLPNMLNANADDGFLFFENNNYYYLVKHPTKDKHYHIESCIASIMSSDVIYEFPLFLSNITSDNLSVSNSKNWEYYEGYYGRISEEYCMVDPDKKEITLKAFMKKSNYEGIGISNEKIVRITWSDTELKFSII